MSIEVRLSGQLGEFVLDAAFEAPGSGVTGLFGPSGCGKTTILRAVAGLARLEGHVRVNGEIWQDETRFVPPYARGVGYVFQEASLFSHLSVRGNLEYGLKRAPTPHAIVWDEVIALLKLEKLLGRGVGKLSGGERQRVAIGRALLSQPRVLLMDEPLSALHRESKGEVSALIGALAQTMKLPVLYVSHDAAEMAALAQRVVKLRDGMVEGVEETASRGEQGGSRSTLETRSVVRGP